MLSKLVSIWVLLHHIRFGVVVVMKNKWRHTEYTGARGESLNDCCWIANEPFMRMYFTYKTDRSYFSSQNFVRACKTSVVLFERVKHIVFWAIFRFFCTLDVISKGENKQTYNFSGYKKFGSEYFRRTFIARIQNIQNLRFNCLQRRKCAHFS